MKKIIPSLFIIFALTGCSTEKPVEFTFNELETPIKVQSQLVEDWFKQENYDYSDMDARINGRTDLGDNLPIHLTFNASSRFEKAYLYYEEGNSYNGAAYEVTSNELDFVNYQLNTEYTVWLRPEFSSNTKLGASSSSAYLRFKTPDAPIRTVTVEGVNNFRDLGDGKKMKQGLIYRSATLENNDIADADNPLNITKNGEIALSRLNMRSEIDLRKDEEKSANYQDKSYIGWLNYFKAPLYYGGENILTYNKGDYNNPKTIKDIFDFLSIKQNYPVDIHCVRGTDRTGCIAFLIKGLMGFSWDELYRDFLFSNFYNIGTPVKKERVYYATNPNATTRYGNVIEQTEGETLKDKIYNYLSSDKVGVDTHTLDTIINLLKA